MPRASSSPNKENMAPGDTSDGSPERVSPSRRRDKGKGKARALSDDDDDELGLDGAEGDEDGDLDMADGTRANGHAQNGGMDGVSDDEEDDDDEGLSEGERKAKEEERKQRRKKALRQRYRALQEKVDDARGDLANISVQDLAAQIEASNSLFKRVEAPAEAILDSRVLMATSEAGALKARQLKIDAGAFDTDEFLARLKRFLGVKGGDGGVRTRKRRGEADEDEDELDEDEQPKGGKNLAWGKVGKVLAGESRRVPPMDFMYGPLALEVKEKKARTQRAKNKVDESQRQRPEELHAEDVAKNENETGKVTSKIHRRLEDVAGDQGIPYLQFVVNPHSFSQTVENMFYFSFLMRENRVALEWDEDVDSPHHGDLITFPVPPETAQEQNDKPTSKLQVVLELTHQTWQDAIDTYGITEPMIPTREAFVPPTANKKYKW